ncbi:MAG: hypothetical protein U0821_13755 [Chloroflexota bacterium]
MVQAWRTYLYTAILVLIGAVFLVSVGLLALLGLAAAGVVALAYRLRRVAGWTRGQPEGSPREVIEGEYVLVKTVESPPAPGGSRVWGR